MPADGAVPMAIRSPGPLPVAGIIFSVLLAVALALVRSAASERSRYRWRLAG